MSSNLSVRSKTILTKIILVLAFWFNLKGNRLITK